MIILIIVKTIVIATVFAVIVIILKKIISILEIEVATKLRKRHFQARQRKNDNSIKPYKHITNKFYMNLIRLI